MTRNPLEWSGMLRVGVTLLLLQLVFIPVQSAMAEESKALLLNGDDLVANSNTHVFVTVLRRKPSEFNSDKFIHSVLKILFTLPSDVFNRTSQLELLEFCPWANLTVNNSSHCNSADKSYAKPNATLVRFGVAVSDAEQVQHLNFMDPEMVVPPTIQLGDPGLFSLEKNWIQYTDLMSPKVVLDKLGTVAIIVLPLIPVCCFFSEWRREQVRNEKRSKAVRRIMGLETSSDQQQPDVLSKEYDEYSTTGQFYSKNTHAAWQFGADGDGAYREMDQKTEDPAFSPRQ
ncbi:hypothetical protein TRVL_06374 [Trypanosoma vivax]|nr:hypothetical protein TRVL_06374 [Trypanosoma vivax]